MDNHTRLMLLLARTLIVDRRRWTRGVMARNRGGRAVSALHETAVCWCAHGAVYLVGGGDIDVYRRVVAAVSDSCRLLYDAPLRAVNDAPSRFAHAAVLGAFDHAIQAGGALMSERPPHAGGRRADGATAR